MANSVDPDQTHPIGAVCSGSTLFASILNSSVMLVNYLQQTTSADDIFSDVFFLGALRVNAVMQLHFLGALQFQLQKFDYDIKGHDSSFAELAPRQCQTPGEGGGGCGYVPPPPPKRL